MEFWSNYLILFLLSADAEIAPVANLEPVAIEGGAVSLGSLASLSDGLWHYINCGFIVQYTLHFFASSWCHQHCHSSWSATSSHWQLLHWQMCWWVIKTYALYLARIRKWETSRSLQQLHNLIQLLAQSFGYLVWTYKFTNPAAVLDRTCWFELNFIEDVWRYMLFWFLRLINPSLLTCLIALCLHLSILIFVLIMYRYGVLIQFCFSCQQMLNLHQLPTWCLWELKEEQNLWDLLHLRLLAVLDRGVEVGRPREKWEEEMLKHVLIHIFSQPEGLQHPWKAIHSAIKEMPSELPEEDCHH